MPTTVPGGYSPDDDGHVRLGKPRHALDDAPARHRGHTDDATRRPPVIALSDLRVHNPSSLRLSVLSNVPRVPTTRGGGHADVTQQPDLSLIHISEPTRR